MLAMTQLHDIRRLFFEEGRNVSEIAKTTGCDRKTVRLYLNKVDWNIEAPVIDHESNYPKLDQYKLDIDGWLTEDKKAKRKQRHTAQRVFDRLQDKYKDGFKCSYRTVAGYVAKKKRYSVRPRVFFPWSTFQERHRSISVTLSFTKTEHFMADCRGGIHILSD